MGRQDIHTLQQLDMFMFIPQPLQDMCMFILQLLITEEVQL